MPLLSWQFEEGGVGRIWSRRAVERVDRLASTADELCDGLLLCVLVRVVWRGAECGLGVCDSCAAAVGADPARGDPPHGLGCVGVRPSSKLGDQVSGRVVLDRRRLGACVRALRGCRSALAGRDLRRSRLQPGDVLVEVVERPLAAGNRLGQQASPTPTGALRGQLLTSVEQLDGAGPMEDSQPGEIGRASCRERV